MVVCAVVKQWQADTGWYSWVTNQLSKNLSGPSILPQWVLSQGFYLIYIWRKQMPKLKSHSGAGKRFKRTGSGGFKFKQAFKRHILTKKSTKRKRQLRKTAILHPSDTPLVARMLPYS